jgi:hypothetical protein
MKKWLIGGGVVGMLVAAQLVAGLVTFALAKGSTPSALSQEATITPEEAKAAALAANPGATVVKVGLERENGTLVYEVELDNGLEVEVDASDGTIVGTDQEDAGEAADDVDDVQDEDEDEVEDADEAGDMDGVDDAEDTDDASDD